MDLNEDGKRDILSGSYSRNGSPMAGLFQVLWGTADGKFKKPEPLKGTDKKPLIIPADPANITRTICTRPFAIDWDADGDLDIVTGNFEGTLFLFTGEGEGKFQPNPTQLKTGTDNLNIEGAHSDPFVIDWDGDGDLDILSGSSQGSVQWSENNAGAGKVPELKRFKTLIEVAKQAESKVGLEFNVPTAPSGSTRVWAADVNGDKKPDLLVGDSVSLSKIADGLSEDEFSKKEAEWQETMESLSKEMAKASQKDGDSPDKKLIQKYHNHHRTRNEFIEEKRTGLVWLYLQK